ncbi:glycoside hydrolase family 95 protein [Paenibacillus tritici]|uniref:glycoside hydrolase family 95 protein n=1 Tax=Paenibacillus tritici TaxID=1873425 RepID=UPI0031BB19AE
MNDYKLWYSAPATGWSQGLPLGNGRIGAVVMAAPLREVWSMTELTYWSGQADPEPAPARGKAVLEEMRRHFMNGDYKEGDRLAKQHLQPGKQNFGTNLRLCEVVIEFVEQGQQPGETGHFRRELDLTAAVAGAVYHGRSGALHREVFASHAGNLVASRIWSSQPGTVSFTLSLVKGTEEFTVAAADGGTLDFESQATEKIHSNGACGVYAKGRVQVIISGGRIHSRDGQLVIEGADEAQIYFAVSTSYRRSGKDWESESRRTLEQAAGKSYGRLREEHIADYREQYDKVNIQLGRSYMADLPTDQRIQSLARGGEDDPQLFALFFQYGRYLTIAGSRADSPLPLHLQGIWNDGEACRMGWSCDYHLDINTQMNYYPAEITNLGESHLPLMRYIEELAQAGRTTARNLYGSPGWVAHVVSNVWGFTLPGWETSWGLNVTGGLWLATHLIEHYEYSRDHGFLERQAYPVLKEAAVFFLDYMCVHPRYGWLVTGPANSPENSFYPGAPRRGSTAAVHGTGYGSDAGAGAV